MSVVKAKCTNCGANLEVDSINDAAVCPYCKTAYVVEKAINNYNTTNYIDAKVVNFFDGQYNPLNQMVKKAQGYLKLDQAEKAFETYCQIAEEYPDECIGHYMMCKLAIDALGYTYSINQEHIGWSNFIGSAFQKDSQIVSRIAVVSKLDPAKAHELTQLYSKKKAEVICFSKEFSARTYERRFIDEDSLEHGGVLLSGSGEKSHLFHILANDDSGEIQQGKINAKIANTEFAKYSMHYDMDQPSSKTNSLSASIVWLSGNRMVMMVELTELVGWDDIFRCFNFVLLNKSYDDDPIGAVDEILNRDFDAFKGKISWKNSKLKTQKQEWMNGGRCRYCGGPFASKGLGIFAEKKYYCQSCGKERNYKLIKQQFGAPHYMIDSTKE